MRKFIYCSLLILLPSLASAAPKANALDLSANFAAWYAQEDDNSQIETWNPKFDQKLQKYFVLIVPGILSDYMDYTLGLFGLETENKFMNFLIRHGLREDLDFQKISLKDGYSGEAGPDVNAAAIIKAIAAQTKPILLFTHSKGSIDTLAVLVDHPELRSKIAGWVTSQSPFYGSPIADQICAHPIEDLPAEIPFEFFGGNQAGLQSLRQGDRQEFMRTHQAEIRQITRKIPTISFATFLPQADLTGWMKLLDGWYGQKMESLFHNRHDGLVPVPSAILPGTHFAIFQGLDHLSSNRAEKPYPALLSILLPVSR